MVGTLVAAEGTLVAAVGAPVVVVGTPVADVGAPVATIGTLVAGDTVGVRMEGVTDGTGNAVGTDELLMGLLLGTTVDFVGDDVLDTNGLPPITIN